MIALMLSACSSQPEEGTLQKNITQRAKNTAFNMMVNLQDTIAKINAGQPPYIDPASPENYVYIYDLELNVIAHPSPREVGQNHSSKTDNYRNDYPQKILKRALGRKRGQEGWIEYSLGSYHRVAYFELAQGRDGYYYIVVSTAPIGSIQQQRAPRNTQPIRSS